MITPLLPACTDLPVWRCAGIRTLETQLQAQSAQPLMDLAGLATARLAMAVAPHARQIWIAAGPGNNGGDGLEAAMHLQQWGKRVQVCLLGDVTQQPADARRARERARQAGVPVHMGLSASPPELDERDLWIDALLGIGACRPPEGALLQAIDRINASQATVLAVDLPTGLDADSGQPLGEPQAMVRAGHTLTFLGSKPGLFMGHGRDACGRIWLAPLGWPADTRIGCPPDAELNPPATPMPRSHASHKGSHGDVAIVGGECLNSASMGGAAVLAAQGALHGGAGRVLLCLLGQTDLAPAAPPDLMRRDLDALELPRLTVVAGCGGGQAIAAPLGRLLQHSARLVLDADALNCVAQDAWMQRLLTERAARRHPTVLTPHPLEAARLLGVDTAQVQSDRIEAARQLAERFDCCVVLKGSGTVIAAPGHLPRINTTGNGLLATGGTGDVLAGLIGARLARMADGWSAACSSVWEHGFVADRWPAGRTLTASGLAASLR
ncbi:MAG: NAD(P)H-hydrate dehydratase [Limnohabitans sp.]